MHTYIHADKQTGSSRQKHTLGVRLKYRKTDRKTDKHNRQTYRQKYRMTDIQTDT